MKFMVTFKTPDALDYSIKDSLEYFEGSEEEKEELKSEMVKLAGHYIKYGEYLSVEFDTETKTAVVLQCNKCY